MFDRQLLEFWGNMLIQTAQGQKQLEELSQWFNQGLKGLNDYMALFGFIPKPEYDRLLREVEVLRDKTRHQEDHIKQLQALLTLQAIDPTEMARGFEDLIKKQSDQFQDLLKDFGLVGKKTTQKEKK